MWNEQKPGTSVKLLVYYNDNEPAKTQTFLSFLAEEKKGTAIAGLTKRILNKLVFGRYKVAIFYENNIEVQRWKNGIRIT